MHPNQEKAGLNAPVTNPLGASVAAPSISSLQLTGRQEALLRVLAERDRRLGQMYSGALHALCQKENPELRVQAAHSIRELLEKTLTYSNLALEENPRKKQRGQPNLKQRAQSLTEIWKKRAKRCQSFDGGKWDGPVDTHLRKILRAVSEFAEGVDTDYPKRKEKIRNLLRKSDLIKTALPNRIETLRVEEWQLCYEYFEGVAHHNPNVDEKDFNGWLDNLERFLLDQFSPRTFQDQTAIDRIIKEGES
ncbi:MAG TPA: hypothetical protein VMV72_15850 [Verrucomicrobiae bacterium]|nr:hypothetical protein [Verrucomicrobiae bacterium]